MAWSDEARAASIAARKASAQSNGVAHQSGVGQVGQRTVSDKAIEVARQGSSKPNGGFSVRPDGTVPTKGYMVAVAGRTQEVTGDAMKANTKAILEGYAQKNADLLRAPNAHIGGWTDPATGRTHLDVAHNIPRQRDAMRMGKERNQIGIHDVRRNRFINTGGKGDLT